MNVSTSRNDLEEGSKTRVGSQESVGGVLCKEESGGKELDGNAERKTSGE